jgi:hypothetical protein
MLTRPEHDDFDHNTLLRWLCAWLMAVPVLVPLVPSAQAQACIVIEHDYADPDAPGRGKLRTFKAMLILNFKPSDTTMVNAHALAAQLRTNALVQDVVKADTRAASHDQLLRSCCHPVTSGDHGTEAC